MPHRHQTPNTAFLLKTQSGCIAQAILKLDSPASGPHAGKYQSTPPVLTWQRRLNARLFSHYQKCSAHCPLTNSTRYFHFLCITSSLHALQPFNNLLRIVQSLYSLLLFQHSLAIFLSSTHTLAEDRRVQMSHRHLPTLQ